MSPRYSYRIVGDGIRNSGPFGLQARSGERETPSVDEGSKVSFVLEIVSASVGAVAMTIGLVVVLIDSAAHALATANGTSTQSHSNDEAVGLSIVGFGLAGIVGGIVLVATNARIGVSQAPLSTSLSTQAGLILPGRSMAFAPRMPAFVDTRREGVPPSVPMLTVPLVGVRF